VDVVDTASRLWRCSQSVYTGDQARPHLRENYDAALDQWIKSLRDSSETDWREPIYNLTEVAFGEHAGGMGSGTAVKASTVYACRVHAGADKRGYGPMVDRLI
jgi:hypothetical protein